MAASDYVLIFFKNRLHLAERQQMSNTRDGASNHDSAFFTSGSIQRWTG